MYEGKITSGLHVHRLHARYWTALSDPRTTQAGQCEANPKQRSFKVTSRTSWTSRHSDWCVRKEQLPETTKRRRTLWDLLCSGRLSSWSGAVRGLTHIQKLFSNCASSKSNSSRRSFQQALSRAHELRSASALPARSLNRAHRHTHSYNISNLKVSGTFRRWHRLVAHCITFRIKVSKAFRCTVQHTQHCQDEYSIHSYNATL